MNRIESFLIGLAVGIATLYLTMHFTVVRATDGFHWIPKVNAKLDLPYEDVRDFKAEHWQRRPALTMSIIKARKAYLMDEQSVQKFKQTTNRMLGQAKQFAPTPNSVTPAYNAPSHSATGLLANSPRLQTP
ncbi:MAG: hypothetical protein RL069_1646 [Planctomycetota bacterium]